MAQQHYARLRADIDTKVRRGACVCPSCGERTPLAKKVKRLQCANCKWEFEVAWGESYLPR